MTMNNPSSLLLTFAEHDPRICFAIQVSNKKFLYLNPSFERFFNIKKEEATLDLLFGYIHPEDQAYVRAAYHAFKPGAFNDGLDFRMLMPEKRLYHLRLIAYLNVKPGQNGTITGYVEDVTTFKEHELRLDELSNKKNAILNILSHDLAGPLGAIQNYTYLLSKNQVVVENEQVAKMILAIEKISKRSTNLIQQFVRNEFLESVGVDVFKTRVNLVEKFGSFMEDYYGVQDDLKKNFEFHYSSDQIFAEIDETKFAQVINNLISNALKFTPDGGTISLDLKETDEGVRIMVSDTGIGIPEEYRKTLFDKFSKARRPGLRGEPSVGLGMSIIKTIVDWHHGKIWFESKVNSGTTFYIEIPKTV
jgi:two-component system sensor histidine kinase VicK